MKRRSKEMLRLIYVHFCIVEVKELSCVGGSLILSIILVLEL